MKKENEDLPTIAASILMMAPNLARGGWAYLKMKKRAQRSSKALERSMVYNGLPPEIARDLAGEFGEVMSITSMMRMASRWK
jgi:hypothetical protein